MKRTMKARYAGTCPQCNAALSVGVEIAQVESGKRRSGWLCPGCADLMARSWRNGDYLMYARNPYVSTVIGGVRFLDGEEFGRGRGTRLEQRALITELEAEREAIQAQKLAQGWRCTR